MDVIGYQLTGGPLVFAIAGAMLVLFGLIVACDVALARERRRSEDLRARVAQYGAQEGQ